MDALTRKRPPLTDGLSNITQANSIIPILYIHSGLYGWNVTSGGRLLGSFISKAKAVSFARAVML
jgi:hypothetical protein